jgi:hypothetical protein
LAVAAINIGCGAMVYFSSVIYTGKYLVVKMTRYITANTLYSDIYLHHVQPLS